MWSQVAKTGQFLGIFITYYVQLLVEKAIEKGQKYNKFMENKSVIHFGTANRTDHHILTKRTLKDKFVKQTTDINTNFSNE